jgi:hypothetical protein
MVDFAKNYGPAQNIDRHASHDLTSLLEGYRATKGMAHAAMGDALVAYLKRISGWRSPYQFFTRTNVAGSWVLVSYHHPAQLCWEWSIWLSVGKQARRSSKPWRWFHHSSRNTSFGIPFLFDISIHRQNDGWMISGNAENLIKFVAQAYAVQGEAA